MACCRSFSCHKALAIIIVGVVSGKVSRLDAARHFGVQVRTIDRMAAETRLAEYTARSICARPRRVRVGR